MPIPLARLGIRCLSPDCPNFNLLRIIGRRQAGWAPIRLHTWHTEVSEQAEREKQVFARKVRVEVLSPGTVRPCPLAWLDSYAMRSFTGRSAFAETLPIADGLLEASFSVDLEALRTDMEDWMTRKFGEGQAVRLRLEAAETVNSGR